MRYKSYIQTFAKFAFLFLSICITAQSFPSEKSAALVLTGATIYPSPDESPITAGVVIIRDGKIERSVQKNRLKFPRMQRF